MEQVDVAQERKHNGSVTTPKAPMTDEQRLAEIVSNALDEVESENIGKFAIKKMPMENAPALIQCTYDALPYYGGKLIKYDCKTSYLYCRYPDCNGHYQVPLTDVGTLPQVWFIRPCLSDDGTPHKLGI